MGLELSKYEAHQLASQSTNPIAIVGQAYVHHGATPLQAVIDPKPSMSGSDFVIYDATTQKVLYRAEGRVLSTSSKILLSDPQGAVICNIKCEPWSSNLAKYKVALGPSSGRVVMEMKATDRMSSLELKVKAGLDGLLYVETSADGKVVYLFSENPKAGGQLLAKSGFNQAGKMVAEVAPGVDVVAVVSLMIVVDAVRMKIKAMMEMI